jgi:U4/U6 small nuclear ribonucleoprotein PRP31
MEQPGTTLTLADALLDDLDDLSDYEEEEEGNVEKEAEEEAQEGGDEEEDERKPPADDLNTFGQEQQQQQRQGGGSDLLGKRFLSDAGLLKHLKAIEVNNSNINNASSSKKSSSSSSSSSSSDYNPTEYPFIVQCNKHLHTLQDEMNKAHNALMTAYAPKFPELQDLLPNNAIAYKNVVAVIRNEMDLSKINADTLLKPFLSSNQIITLSVAGSTTNGRPLTDAELHQVDDILHYMDEIIVVQQTLSRFVELRMQGLAPSISVLIGTHMAARLVGLAGGLAELCRIPACNLQVLGQVKQSASSRAGFASTTAAPQGGASHNHAGVLVECDLVQRAPRHLQSKMLKTVASKLALAARCDWNHLQHPGGGSTASTSSNGGNGAAAAGLAFRAQVEAKLQQWQEPDKAPVLKALPK